MPEAVSVKAFRAEKRPVSSYILSNTTLESIRKVTIASRLNALVRAIHVEEGDRVRQGQTLLELDDREIRNEYEQARIAVDQSEIALRQARVKAQLSQANFERSASLLEQKLISQQEFDQTDLVNQTDTLALEVAQQQAAASRARLEAAQLQLSYTRIESSIDGVVTQRLVDVGTRVSPNDPVFVVEDFTPLWARIFVPEKDLPRIQLGKTARLRLQAYPERDFTGVVHMINPTVDAESGTVKVTLEVSRDLNLLRPGMFGTAYIAVETRPDAVVIPRHAVLRERDENKAFVIGPEGTVEKRTLELGFSEDNVVEIVSGVREGEGVVTVGQEGLSDGYGVQVLAWENPPSPAQASDRSAEVADAPARRPDPARRGFGGQAPDLERMLQNPAFKEAYEAELKKDPDFWEDADKRRAFFQRIRQQQGRGRP